MSNFAYELENLLELDIVRVVGRFFWVPVVCL